MTIEKFKEINSKMLDILKDENSDLRTGTFD